jgi:hypothetical protein
MAATTPRACPHKRRPLDLSSRSVPSALRCHPAGHDRCVVIGKPDRGDFEVELRDASTGEHGLPIEQSGARIATNVTMWISGRRAAAERLAPPQEDDPPTRGRRQQHITHGASQIPAWWLVGKTLAGHVRNALAAAGLPIVAPNSPRVRSRVSLGERHARVARAADALRPPLESPQDAASDRPLRRRTSAESPESAACRRPPPRSP